MGLARYTWRTFIREIVFIVGTTIWWIPLFFIVEVSLKPTIENFTSPSSLPHHVTFSNYPKAWQGTSVGTLGQAMKSSAIITGGSVILIVLLGSACAYVLARRAGRLGSALYYGFVLGIIMPIQLAIVPTYVVLRHLHLAGSYFGLILMYTALLLPLSVFLYTGFVRTLPREYEEAAQVDGAHLLRTYWRVVLPLLRPITVTVATLTGLIIWNDFFISLIFLSGTPHETLPVAIYGFVGEYATDWSLVFAAVGISTLPLLAFFFVTQRRLMHGFAGGIKA